MISDAIQIGIELAAVPFAFWLGRKLKKPAIVVPVEAPVDALPVCTGYLTGGRDNKGRFTSAKAHTDCKALRSPICLDGRCSYHCNSHCRCDVVKHPRV